MKVQDWAARAAFIGIFCMSMGSWLAVGQASDKPMSSEKPASAAAVEKSKTAEAAERPFLGIRVEPVNPAFVSHLAEAQRNGQGLLVVGVLKGSPADKAGIKVHDIVMCYGDQKLFSPRQLAALVREGKSGEKVHLTVLREGKSETLKVTVGEHQRLARGESEKPEQGLTPGSEQQAASGNRQAQSSRPGDWESFDSMTIKKLGKDKFNAEIEYLSKDGKIDHKTFEGSREEIERQIGNQKDLPKGEAHQLLRSLDLPMAGFGAADLPSSAADSQAENY